MWQQFKIIAAQLVVDVCCTTSNPAVLHRLAKPGLGRAFLLQISLLNLLPTRTGGHDPGRPFRNRGCGSFFHDDIFEFAILVI
ncbi:hypothetical protein [Azonexus sp.]|uniref:hypothetical protein n=1 Tax=Azonexus sp. TaxID=1872668 RepID=UPI0035B17DA3